MSLAIGRAFGESIQVTEEIQAQTLNAKNAIPFTTAPSGTKFSESKMDTLYNGAQVIAQSTDGQVGGVYMGYTTNGVVGSANGFISVRRADGSVGSTNGTEEVLHLNPGGGKVRVNGSIVSTSFIVNAGVEQVNLYTKLKALEESGGSGSSSALEARVALLEARLNSLIGSQKNMA